jgi:hypothetical protein
MSAAGMLDAVVTQFAADEALTPVERYGGLAIAAAGTIADAAADNPLLDAACTSAGVRIATRSTRAPGRPAGSSELGTRADRQPS